MRGDELARRSQGDHLAVIHDRHAVAQPLGLVHVVRGQQDGAAGALNRSMSPRAAAAPAGRARWSARRETAAPDRRPARTRAQAAASVRPTASPTRACCFSSSCTSADYASRRRDLLEEAAEKLQGFLHGELVGQLRLLQLRCRDAGADAAASVAQRRPSTSTSPESGASALRKSQSSSSCRRRSGPSRPKHCSGVDVEIDAGDRFHILVALVERAHTKSRRR